MLVSLNPFKRLPIYGADALSANAAPAPNTVRDPHTYAIASAAYHYIRREARDTSILISGESGAGKTEATKQCLNFLADTAGSHSGVEQRILSANPILEAFGMRLTATCHRHVSPPRVTTTCHRRSLKSGPSWQRVL